MTEKLSYSQICGTKVVPVKNAVIALLEIIFCSAYDPTEGGYGQHGYADLVQKMYKLYTVVTPKLGALIVRVSCKNNRNN